MTTRTPSPIRDTIKNALREQARLLGPHGKLPTVVELCNRLGVAKATINSALDELQSEGIIRRRRGSGIYVTPRINHKTVGLVFGGDIFRVGISPFFALLVDRCRERATGHGEHFSFFFNLQLPHTSIKGIPVHQDLAEAIAGGRLHGVILGTGVGESEENWLRSQGVPVVSFGLQALASPHAVVIDYPALIRMGIETLVEQGCRRIGFVTPFGNRRDDGASKLTFDLQTFTSELTSHGLPWNTDWIWEWREAESRTPLLHEEQGYRAALELFAAEKAGKWPDGLVSADDMMTRGALVGLRRRGLVAGKDVKIATHANSGSPALHGYEDVLTRLEVNLDELVDRLFDMLERLMADQAVGNEMPIVHPRLVAEGDTGSVENSACQATAIDRSE